MKTKRTKEEKRVRAISSNESLRQRVMRMQELNIPQVDVTAELEPTPEEEEALSAKVYAAGAEIQKAQREGLLPLPKNYVSQGFYQPSIKEYRKVTHNNLPLYS